MCTVDVPIFQLDADVTFDVNLSSRTKVLYCEGFSEEISKVRHPGNKK